ncbi:MAG: hypothetical protein Q7S96_04875 [bacterium]|nr:hypothetical protein [bacterium]
MVAVETPSDSWKRALGHPVLQGCVLMVLAVIIAIIVQVPGHFPDPDSYYHAGMAELAAEGVFEQTFPWLTLTNFPETFADLHFVYHLVLVPFVNIFGTATGLRIATIAAVGLLAITFSALLRTLNVRGAFWLTALLLGSSSFMLRANLAKSQGFAFTILFLGMTAAAKRSHIGIFLATLFATWTSSHWPVLTVAVCAFALAQCVVEIVDGTAPTLRIGKPFLRMCGMILTALCGNAVALIVNPYFPANLTMAREQILNIAVIGGIPEAIPGGEWVPLSVMELASAIGFLIPLLLIATYGLMVLIMRTVRGTDANGRQTTAYAIATALLAATFFALTLGARRHIEFLTPLLIAFIAVGIQPAVQWAWPPRVAIAWRRPGELRRPLATIMLLVAIAGFTVGAIRGIRAQRERFATGYSVETLAGASAWIAEHAPENAIIFHADWDDFPLLFFHDRRHRYLVGLDPRFAYYHNRERYRELLAIRAGDIPDGRIAQRIIAVTDASYAIVTADQPELTALLDADLDATQVYGDDEARVYAL